MNETIEQKLKEVNEVREYLSDEEFTGYLVGELVRSWKGAKFYGDLYAAQQNRETMAKIRAKEKAEEDEPKKETAPSPVPPAQETEEEPKKPGRKPSWNVQKASTMWAAGWDEHKIVEALQKDGDSITLKNFRQYRERNTNMFTAREGDE